MRKMIAAAAALAATIFSPAAAEDIDTFEKAALMVLVNSECGDVFSEETIGFAMLLGGAERGLRGGMDEITMLVSARAVALGEQMRQNGTRADLCDAAQKMKGQGSE